MAAMACVAAGPKNGMPKKAVRYPAAMSKTEAKSFEKDGKKLFYRYHEPKKFESGKKYPLVILLHGAGERGYNNWSQLKHGASNILDFAERNGEEIFFVAGQVPFNGRWVDRPGQAQSPKAKQVPDAKLPLALALADQLIKDKPVDVARVYVTGLSMGGHGTWQALLTRPDFFAAAIPICGWGDVSQAAKLKDVPIWCFHGDQDPAVAVRCSRDMVAAIKAAGGTKVQYREYPGVGHDSWTATYRDDSVLKWLFSQKK